MAQQIDKEQFPKTMIKIPKEEFPDKLTIVFKGNDLTKPDYGRKAELVASSADQALGSPISGAASGASEAVQMFEFIGLEAFGEEESIKGVNYKIARIDTPFSNLTSVRAFASRDNWENTTPINIEMTATPESRTNIEGSIWNRRITLRKHPELSIDYSIDYIMNGTALAIGGQLASLVGPFMTSITTVLSGEMLPTVPTAKQLASKLMGPASAYVQQGLAIINTQYAKVKPYIDGFNFVVDMVENCTDVEAPSVDFSLSKLKIPDFGIRQQVIDFLNGIADQIPGIKPEDIDVPNLPNTEINFGISNECIDSLYTLFEFVYELVPKEGIAGTIIYEYGE